MANVTLLSYTPYAAELMIFTKRTRLNMSPDSFRQVHKMTQDEKLVELKAMSRTLPSSWEFCDFTFLIEHATRAFTHQLVRTRQASYAQQAMRVVHQDQFGYDIPEAYNGDLPKVATYTKAMHKIQEAYDQLIADGSHTEDARGVLPTNIHTNIVAKFNLRTLSELMSKRLYSGRVQGEYRDVLGQMKMKVEAVYPWTSMFLEPRAANEYVSLERTLADKLGRNTPEFLEAIKSLDIIRSEQG